MNAEAERIDNKPAFREAFHRRRCLAPSTTFMNGRKRVTEMRPFDFRHTSSTLPVVLLSIRLMWVASPRGFEPLLPP
ncbi:MAG: SOS response-associated peptidase family protein [Stellaceae bacterium]